MASARKISANRANAKKSSGPRSQVGKKHSAQNATKHGLAIRSAVEGTRSDEIEHLAHFLTSDEHALPYARDAAEATFEISRIRRVRTAILNRIERGSPGETLAILTSAWRIDRYEKRALSRRKRAIRQIMRLEAFHEAM
jgi:hypothetical protein